LLVAAPCCPIQNLNKAWSFNQNWPFLVGHIVFFRHIWENILNPLYPCCTFSITLQTYRYFINYVEESQMTVLISVLLFCDFWALLNIKLIEVYRKTLDVATDVITFVVKFWSNFSCFNRKNMVHLNFTVKIWPLN
jgi:hypothetical protein